MDREAIMGLVEGLVARVFEEVGGSGAQGGRGGGRV